MMYKKLLKSKINPHKLLVANAVKEEFGNSINDNDFEIICEFVFNWVSQTLMHASELCRLINFCLYQEDFCINDLKDKKDFCTNILNSYI